MIDKSASWSSLRHRDAQKTITDDEAARTLLQAAFKISRDLGDLFRSLGEDERGARDAVSLAIYKLHEAVIQPVLEASPGVKVEIEARTGEKGRAFEI